MKAYFKFLLILLTALPLAGWAASFDCQKAHSTVEKAICSDPELSQLDTQLAQVYFNALKALAKESYKPRLVQEQKNWITYARNICLDAVCLHKAYKARIQILSINNPYLTDPAGDCNKFYDKKLGCSNIVYYRDPSIRIDSFNQSMTQDGKIIGCSQLIDLSIGLANSNDSFGGVCTLQEGNVRSIVKICDDDMIGHFAMEKIEDDNVLDKDLVKFTDKNCFGG